MQKAGRASGGAAVDPEVSLAAAGDLEALRGAGLRRMMAAEEPQQKPEPLGGDADGTDGLRPGPLPGFPLRPGTPPTRVAPDRNPPAPYGGPRAGARSSPIGPPIPL